VLAEVAEPPTVVGARSRTRAARADATELEVLTAGIADALEPLSPAGTAED
jgi:hypothetical protein